MKNFIFRGFGGVRTAMLIVGDGERNDKQRGAAGQVLVMVQARVEI